MVPTLVHEIGCWLDQFGETLNGWESLLCDLRSAYLRNDEKQMDRMASEVADAHCMMGKCKTARAEILGQAAAKGFVAKNFRELSRQLDGHWPALWTHRLQSLENQVARIQQLGVSLWIHAPHSREIVSDLLQTLGEKQSTSRSVEKLDRIPAVEKGPLHEEEPILLPFPRQAA